MDAADMGTTHWILAEGLILVVNATLSFIVATIVGLAIKERSSIGARTSGTPKRG